MTSVVRQKNVTCIEWTVKTCSSVYSLPLLSSKIDSKCFTFENRKCNLEFYTDISSNGDACLYFRRDGTQLPELDVMVLASGTGNSVQRSMVPERHKITGRYAKIWSHGAGKLLGSSLTFEIFINSRHSKSEFAFYLFYFILFFVLKN